MRMTARLPYISGWLWNLTTALRTLILPLIPITLLVFLPDEIRLRNALLLIPAVITGTVLYPLWHNAPYSPQDLAAGPRGRAGHRCSRSGITRVVRPCPGSQRAGRATRSAGSGGA